MLDAVELDTCILAGLPDFANLFFLLTKTEVDTLVLVRELFSKSILKTNHQNLMQILEAEANLRGQQGGKFRHHHQNTGRHHPVVGRHLGYSY